MATTVTLKPNAIDISGSTSGTTTLQATAVAGTTTLTLPAATDTLVGKATTDTLTNKTLTGAVMNGTIGATTPAAGTFTSLSDSGNLTFTGTGNRITGDFSNNTVGNRVGFQSSTVNGQTALLALPNGTSAQTQIQILNSSDSANASIGQILINATEMRFHPTFAGTGTYLPMTFYTNGSERVRIDTSGNVGIGTTSPSFPLTVVTSSSALGIAINGRSSDNFGSMYFYANNGSTQYATITASATEFRLSSVPSAAVQTFYTNASERMRIDSSGNVGIGGTANASAILDAQSTTKGVRMPNMTTTQKNAIASPAAGLMVFDTTLAKLCVYSGSAWQTITSI
jgi:hypothetical protein